MYYGVKMAQSDTFPRNGMKASMNMDCCGICDVKITWNYFS